MEPLHKLILTVAYLGTHYAGSQVQDNGITVQDLLDKALRKLFDQKDLKTIFSGRTDSGVHALRQIVSAEVRVRRPEEKVLKALSTLLPKDIVVTQVRYLDQQLHPRFDAKRRVYLYNIFCGKAPLYIKDVVWPVADALDILAMRQAAKVLKGTHDFSAFCAARSYADNKIRTIYRSELKISKVPEWLGVKSSAGKMITYRVEADAFLYHMVRNIVATLVDVGRGDLTVSEVRRILQTKDRKQLPSATAPATGLVLYDVQYADVRKRRRVI